MPGKKEKNKLNNIYIILTGGVVISLIAFLLIDYYISKNFTIFDDFHNDRRILINNGVEIAGFTWDAGGGTWNNASGRNIRSYRINGVYKHIISDGVNKMYGKSNFINGYPDGEAKYYYNKSGSAPLAQIRYFNRESNSYKDAYVKQFYHSGNLEFVMTYEETGNVKEVLIYSDSNPGELVEAREYKDGKLISDREGIK